jgi:integrase
LDARGCDGKYLFPGRNGIQLTTAAIRKAFADIFDTAAIKGKGVHGLRHWSITQTLIATGGDLAKTRRRSRHSSFDMLVVYDDERLSMYDADHMAEHISAIV